MHWNYIYLVIIVYLITLDTKFHDSVNIQLKRQHYPKVISLQNFAIYKLFLYQLKPKTTHYFHSSKLQSYKWFKLIIICMFLTNHILFYSLKKYNLWFSAPRPTISCSIHQKCRYLKSSLSTFMIKLLEKKTFMIKGKN